MELSQEMAVQVFHTDACMLQAPFVPDLCQDPVQAFLSHVRQCSNAQALKVMFIGKGAYEVQ